MGKVIEYGKDAREVLKSGVDGVANAVKVTLGARGRNVAIDRGFPHYTKDGVTVAESIDFEDPMKNMGATTVKQAAQNTRDEAGDGTSTATILAQAMINYGMQLVDDGVNPMEIKKGIDKAVKAVVNVIKADTTKVNMDNIEDIATVSANNDKELGKIIADAFRKVTSSGVVKAEESKGYETTLTTVDGMRFDKGYYSPFFINNAKEECELENPYILISDKKIETLNSIMPLIEKIIDENNQSGRLRPLLVICEEMGAEPLAALLVNIQRGQFKSCVVQCPGFGDIRKEWTEDISVLTGGKFVTDMQADKIKNMGLCELGNADKVIVGRRHTTIIGGKGEKEDIDKRIEDIREVLKETKKDFRKKQLEERIAKLSGGVAIINIGGASEAEVKEKADRVDDAICACKAAFEEGIVPGGGIVFMRAVNELGKLYEGFTGSSDELHGVTLVESAIQEPFITIAENAGIENEDNTFVQAYGTKEGEGFNVIAEQFEDLYKSGIIDPAKVLRVALINAASVAGTLLTTECAITDKQ